MLVVIIIVFMCALAEKTFQFNNKATGSLENILKVWQDRKGQNRKGQERTGKDRKGQDRTGQDRTGQDRTGQDRTIFEFWLVLLLDKIWTPKTFLGFGQFVINVSKELFFVTWMFDVYQFLNQDLLWKLRYSKTYLY